MKAQEIYEETIKKVSEVGNELFKRHPELEQEILLFASMCRASLILKILSGDMESFKTPLSQIGDEERKELFIPVIQEMCSAICPDSGYIVIRVDPIADEKAVIHAGFSMEDKHCKGILKAVIERMEREEGLETLLPEFYEALRAKSENH